MQLAYEQVKDVDSLDIGKEGSESWEAALRRYDERIDRVEARITARLRDQLGTAKNANEMFRWVMESDGNPWLGIVLTVLTKGRVQGYF